MGDPYDDDETIADPSHPAAPPFPDLRACGSFRLRQDGNAGRVYVSTSYVWKGVSMDVDKAGLPQAASLGPNLGPRLDRRRFVLEALVASLGGVMGGVSALRAARAGGVTRYSDARLETTGSPVPSGKVIAAAGLEAPLHVMMQ